MSPTFSLGYDMANSFPLQMCASQLTRRPSRGSASQRSRIEKPRSNHNSPRPVERRKTTSGTKRYATLDDHYNMMFGITREEEAMDERPEPTRPVSWHPSSAQFLAPGRSSRIEQSPSRHSTYGSDFYSLSARSSVYPEQRQSYSIHPNPQSSHRSSQDSSSSWQEVLQPTPTYTLSAYSTPTTEPMPWYLQEWARKNEVEAGASRNGSSNFLPIQHPAAEPEPSSEEDEVVHGPGKELVGLGLYDQQDDEQSWSFGVAESTGKGLKLEETWQPPEEDSDAEEEEADEVEDNDDASSDDGSVEELPAPKQRNNEVEMPVVVNIKPQDSLSGQSFFFDEDETMKTEWWFHQLKQPSLPMRNTGGYGWL